MGTDTLEYDLGGRISALADEKVRIVQVACGNGLSPGEDYSYIIPWLESQGFSVLRTAFPSCRQLMFRLLFLIPIFLL